MARGIGENQRKILLLLLGGLALGLSRSPRQYCKILNELREEWKITNKQRMERAIGALYRSKLVETKNTRSGLTLVLTENGRRRALTYAIDDMRVKKPRRWDGKWRLVLFDIPEKIKKVRESLRLHLRNMGFYEFQRSVFVHPFPCKDEVEYIIEFYNVRRHVRFVLAHSTDNEPELKKHFGLS